MSFICKVDNSTHESLEDLHKKLRKFKIKQADYYEEYYPKKDLLTGEKIPFKSYDQYFSAKFLNKENMVIWFKKNPSQALNVSKEMLIERKEKKGLVYAPTEIELLTTGLPSIRFFERNGGYNNIMQSLGFVTHKDYSFEKMEFNSFTGKVVVDTRESQPLDFSKIPTVTKKLDFGDYAVEGRENEVVVERKSLTDLIGTFVNQFDRVEREFIRAKESGAYLVVVCEESLHTATHYQSTFLKRYIKVKPEVLFYNIRHLAQKYQVQFLFCDGRGEATKTIMELFTCKQDIRKIDLQYFYNYVGRA